MGVKLKKKLWHCTLLHNCEFTSATEFENVSLHETSYID